MPFLNDPNEDNRNAVISWTDSIGADDVDYVVLDEGIYKFSVLKYVPGEFPGSEKMCACDKAVLTLKIESDDGVTIIKDDLILHKCTEWKLSQFFRAIGQKKKGERMVMNWAAVPGSTGMAHVITHSFVDSYGNTRTINKIERYLDPNTIHD